MKKKINIVKAIQKMRPKNELIESVKTIQGQDNFRDIKTVAEKKKK